MSGDELFTDLYRKYHLDIYRYLVVHVKNWTNAEDICQEVFLEAYRNIHKLYQHPEPKGFLVRIAQYKLLNFLTYHKKRKNIEVFIDDNTEYEEKLCSDDIERLHFRITLQEILDRDELQLLEEYHIKGFTSKEIAVTKQKSDAAIRMRYQRMLQKLAKHWGSDK